MAGSSQAAAGATGKAGEVRNGCRRMVFPVRKRHSILFLSCALAWMLLACDRDNQSAHAKGQNPPATAASDSTLPTFSLPADNAPAPAFDGNRALPYVKDIVAFGPRPVGSANHKKG